MEQTDALARGVARAVQASCPPGLTNPYLGPGGRARTRNLERYLAFYAAQAPIDVLLVLEAAGRNGSARTGVPATNLALAAEYPFPLAHDHASVPAPDRADNTSLRVWRSAWSLNPHRIACWNAVPWHPARFGHDRPPRAPEVGAGLPVLRQVLALLRPTKVVAVGRTAEAALLAVGSVAPYVPHPAQDRYKEFVHRINEEVAA